MADTESVPGESTSGASAGEKPCPMCAEMIKSAAVVCRHCGSDFRASRPIVAQRGQKTNGLAIASMVLGVVWISWIGSLLAVVFGHIALSQIKKSDGEEGGRGLAIAGLILGYIGLGVLVFVIVAVVALGTSEFYGLGL